MNVSNTDAWQDPETLRDLYHGEGLSLMEIGDRLGCSNRTVANWMERHGIPTRDPAHERDYSGRRSPRFVEYARYETNGDGYGVWRFRADDCAVVSVHRLAAVAWFGWEAMQDAVVHHEDGIPWHNAEDNLRVMEDSEHKAMHARQRSRIDGRFE